MKAISERLRRMAANARRVSWVLLATASGFSGGAQPVVEASLVSPLLTNAAQLRALSGTEAGRRLPVKLRGIVTAINSSYTIFLQDVTGGTFIKLNAGAPAGLTEGDVVEVDGMERNGVGSA